MAELKLVLEEVLERTDDYELMEGRIDGKKERHWLKIFWTDKSLLDSPPAPIGHKNNNTAMIVSCSCSVHPFGCSLVLLFASSYSQLADCSRDAGLVQRTGRPLQSPRLRLLLDLLRSSYFFEENKRYCRLTPRDLLLTDGRLVVLPRNPFVLLTCADQKLLDQLLSPDVISRDDFFVQVAQLCMWILFGQKLSLPLTAETVDGLLAATDFDHDHESLIKHVISSMARKSLSKFMLDELDSILRLALSNPLEPQDSHRIDRYREALVDSLEQNPRPRCEPLDDVSDSCVIEVQVFDESLHHLARQSSDHIPLNQLTYRTTPPHHHLLRVDDEVITENYCLPQEMHRLIHQHTPLHHIEQAKDIRRNEILPLQSTTQTTFTSRPPHQTNPFEDDTISQPPVDSAEASRSYDIHRGHRTATAPNHQHSPAPHRHLSRDASHPPQTDCCTIECITTERLLTKCSPPPDPSVLGKTHHCLSESTVLAAMSA